jgi:hypothetical protein
MYKRKNVRRPVFDQGLSAMLARELTPSKKPEPVLSESWFEAEAEIYAAVSRLGESILGAGGLPPKQPPPGGGGLPTPDDGFDGKWIGVSLADAEYLPGSANQRAGVLLPVTLKRSGKTVWAAVQQGRTKEQNQQTVDAIVTASLQRVQSEVRPPTRAEDETGIVQTSVNTFAVFAEDKDAARSMILSSS